MRSLSTGRAVFTTAVVCLAALQTTQLSAQTVAGGIQHSLIIKSDGTVWATGENGDGQLGDNSTVDRRLPAVVPGLTGITAVAAGRAHSLALDSSGVLRVWGDNLYGQVGDNSSSNDRRQPVTLSLASVVEIAAGDYHSLARLSNGDVYAWGRNNVGQLGLGSMTNALVPTLVTTGAIAIGAGSTHTLIVKTDNTVWGAGSNGNGQLGDTTTSPKTSLTQMASVTNAAKVAGGLRHSLVLLTDGTLKAVGRNTEGQLGDTTTQQRTTAVAVSTVANISAIHAGEDLSMARASDGTVWTWGLNSSGQLGDGAAANRSTPYQNGALADITSIAAGELHALAVDSAGTVFTWGKNDAGQLGDGTLVNRTAPVAISSTAFEWRVSTPSFSHNTDTYEDNLSVVVTSVTAGVTIHYTVNGAEPTESDPVIASGGSIPITTSQTLKAKAWKVGMPASPTAIAVYELKVKDLTFTPGQGTSTTPRNVAISTLSSGVTIRYTLDTSEPHAGSLEYTGPITIATTTTLKAVGFKPTWTQSTTKTGLYTMNFGTAPTPTASPAAGAYTGVIGVTLSALSGSTIRYTTNGNDPGTGSQTYSPSTPVAIGTSVILKAKAWHGDYGTASLVMSQSYTITVATPVLSRASGEYAPGDTVVITHPDPAATIRITLNGATPTATDAIVASGTSLLVGNFTLKARAFRTGATDSAIAEAAYTQSGPLTTGAIAAGTSHTLVATTDGRLWGWGLNSSGQVGDGSSTLRTSPVLVSSLTGVTKLAAGSAHTLAATRDGRLYAWGANGSGRLGDGTTTPRNAPVEITAISDVIAVAAGDTHSLALTSAGLVYAWGLNSSGQLGQNDTTNLSTPTQVPGLTNVVGIAAGAAFSLAVTASGDLYAWGANGSGQLGDGSSSPRLSPWLVSLAGVEEVAAGATHTLARVTGGAVYAWGLGGSGQLGLGNTQNKNTPNLITGLTAASIHAGAANSAAIRSDGVLLTWGANASGQIGDGSTSTRNTPTVAAAPADVAQLGLGTSYAVAITAGGEVWSWGLGTGGQLGQGASETRWTPEAISGPDYDWRAATPVISLANTNEYTTDQSTTISTGTAGAVVRYTVNGAEPTELDPTLAPGAPLAIDQSLTLKAKSFHAFMPPSATAIRTYVMRVGRPGFTPNGGTFTSPTSVAISNDTANDAIYYTTDGTEPTTASTLYTTSVPIATTTTLKAIGFRAGWSNSLERSTPFTMSFGQLPAPQATPAPGNYEGEVVVTLTSLPAATIRYSTSASNPTTTSPNFTKPLVYSTSVTLRVKAWHPDYSESPVSTYVYSVTPAAPTLSTPGGAYAPGETVTITHPDPAATIRVTLTGVDPTASDPAVPSGWKMAIGAFTLKARAFKSGATDSAVSQEAYTLTSPIGPGLLSFGGAYSALSTPSGLLYTWGLNGFGQLGDGTQINRSTPQLRQTVTGLTALSAGFDHTLALTADGRVLAWGRNSEGQIGDGSMTNKLTPVELSVPPNVVTVAAGDSNSYALTSTGEVYAWGNNGAGQAGLGFTSPRVLTPTLVPGLSNIVAIAADGGHALALNEDGQIYAWGANTGGQLGNSTTIDRLSPTLITTVSDIAAVAAGQGYSLALARNGTVYAWGTHTAGGLGLGATQATYAPTAIPGLTATVIAADANMSHALRSDGVLMSWGANFSGQVGDGTTIDRATPTPAIGLPGLAMVTAGFGFSGAITPAGELWTWGDNSYGQLGTGNTTPRSTPAAVFTASGVWGVTAAPLPNVASGIYHDVLDVSATSATPDAIIRYTTSATTPTESDPELSSGTTLPITGTATLTFRAWSPGRAPSVPVTRTYVLRPATPVIAPVTGTYTTSQTVVISTATVGASVRYTTNGSEPDAGSTLYTSSFPLATTTVVKARAFVNGWTQSADAVSAITFDYGTLTAPIAAPAAGSYAPGQLVALTAQAGTAIYYSLDGSVPTPASNLYTAPISIGQSGSLTIRARAFKVDYTSSAITTATYTVSSTPPPSATLTAITVSPSQAVVKGGVATQFTAAGTYSDGSVRDVTALATWASANEIVATVSNTGAAKGGAKGETEIRAAIGPISDIASLIVTQPVFTFTGELRSNWTYADAVRLNDGRVMVIGRRGELYDPATGVFTLMPEYIADNVSYGFTVTPLPNGKVLFAGGGTDDFRESKAARLWDPATGVFELTGSLSVARGAHTATLLPDGRVLIAGGVSSLASLSSTELYDPVTGQFTIGAPLLQGRVHHHAVLLQSGKVLMVGGGATWNAANEVYDPVAGASAAVGAFGVERDTFTATLLANGKVLVAGGEASVSGVYGPAELFDPASGTFTTTGKFITPRSGTATRLLNGDVLFIGGSSDTSTAIATAELYDPETGAFSVAGTLNVKRTGHFAALLADGRVLAGGGRQKFYSWEPGPEYTRSAEIYSDGALPAPLALQIMPGGGAMLVGETRTLMAVDQLGRPRPDATWSVNDPLLATLSTGAEPTLTAIAEGPVTVTVTVGAQTQETTIDIVALTELPEGTVRWQIEAPLGGLVGPAFVPQYIVKAHRTASATTALPHPDLYYISSTATESIVQAVTDKGILLWMRRMPLLNRNSAPNGYGGLIVTMYNTCDNSNRMRIANLEAGTGMIMWEVEGLSSCTAQAPEISIRHDGNVNVVFAGNTSGFPEVLVIEGLTGAIISIPNVPDSSYRQTSGSSPTYGYSPVGPSIVTSDGKTVLAYGRRDLTIDPSSVQGSTIGLMELGELGPIYTTVSEAQPGDLLLPGKTIPDGTGGYITTWLHQKPVNQPKPVRPFKAARLSPTGQKLVEFDLPFTPTQLELGPDGVTVYPVIVLAEPAIGGFYVSYGNQVFALNNSGSTRWQYTRSEYSKLVVYAVEEADQIVLKATKPSNTDFEYVVRVMGGSHLQESEPARKSEHYANNDWVKISPEGSAFQMVRRSLLNYGGSEWMMPTQAGTNQSPPRPFTHVVGFSNTGPDQAKLTNILVKIKTALALPEHAGCKAWMDSGPQAGESITYLNTVLAENLYGHGEYDWTIIAFKGWGNVLGIPDGTAITFNRLSAYYVPLTPKATAWQYPGGTQYYVGGLPWMQAHQWIHELAHLMDLEGELSDNFPGDPIQSEINTRSNNSLVSLQCGRMIESIR